jgi:hypothetical protein
MLMKIEKNIPIPHAKSKYRNKYSYLRDMEYGDSVATDCDIKKQAISAAIRGYDPYCKVVTRTLRNENNNREIRIWKVQITEEKLCRHCGQVVRPKQEGESL